MPSSAVTSLSQNPLTIGMAKLQGVWDICLVQGEGRGKSTSKRDLTTPQIYPRGILSSTSLHGRNDYPDSQVELKFFTLCFFGSSAIICTLQELSEPTNIHCIPPHTSYLGQHTPLCPRLPSPPTITCHFFSWSSWLGAPSMQWLGAPTLAPDCLS